MHWVEYRLSLQHMCYLFAIGMSMRNLHTLIFYPQQHQSIVTESGRIGYHSPKLRYIQHTARRVKIYVGSASYTRDGTYFLSSAAFNNRRVFSGCTRAARTLKVFLKASLFKISLGPVYGGGDTSMNS